MLRLITVCILLFVWSSNIFAQQKPDNSLAPQIHVVQGTIGPTGAAYISGLNLTNAQVSACWGTWCTVNRQSSFNSTGGFAILNIGAATLEWATANLDLVLTVDGNKVISKPYKEVIPWGISVSNRTDFSWTAPTKNEDGTNITEIRFVNLYYSLNSPTVTKTDSRIILRKNNLTHVLTNLPPGDWKFAVSVVDGNNIESRLTNIVPKTIL